MRCVENDSLFQIENKSNQLFLEILKKYEIGFFRLIRILKKSDYLKQTIKENW